MAYPFAASSNSHEPPVAVAQVNHLPIVADFARRLGLVEIVNRLVPVDMAVEPGVIVLGMVLDTLSGRSPLYHLESAFSDCDRAVLFGQEIPANTFSDDNVGRVMDRIFAAGTQRVFSTLSVAAMEQFALTAKHVHFDTTSVNVFGDYNTPDDEQVPFHIGQEDQPPRAR
jgi:hypothetical protein